MPIDESPPLFPPRCDCIASDTSRTVVWVRGEHDAATCVQLSVTLARAAGVDDADIVVDLSGVTFMDASTIGAVMVARNRLRVLSRCLWVRDPSPQARRLLELCGLARLIDEHPAPAQPHRATALGSWVEVPARDRGSGSDQAIVAGDARSEEPVCVMARRRIEPVGLVQQRRPPS